MPQQPVNDEIAAVLGKYFFGGSGPSHSELSRVFITAGYSQDDPYDRTTQKPNKESRVRSVVQAACRRPDRALALVNGLLTALRVHGCFDSVHDSYNPDAVRTSQRAFQGNGWLLHDDGTLSPAGPIDFTTGGRTALDEQLDRLRRSTNDPGQLLGTAKDLLEAVARFVLEEFEVPLPKAPTFDHLWHLARDRLGILPQQVNAELPGGQQVRTIMQSAWTIAQQTNELRGLQGTGHGRTLPTGISAELAFFVVREACSVAEYALTQLDRMLGR